MIQNNNTNNTIISGNRWYITEEYFKKVYFDAISCILLFGVLVGGQ